MNHLPSYVRRMAFILGLVMLEIANPNAAAGQSDAAAERELRSAAERVASQWNQGGVSGLAELLVERGIGLHTGGAGRETLDPRKALAALDDLLARRRTRSCSVERVTMGAGTARGSAEMAWEAVAPGTSEVLRYTVFVAFLRVDAGWRISEIRVLP